MKSLMSARAATGMLASVMTTDEARIAVDAGADIIDLKNPRQGALGALDSETIRAVVKTVAGRVPVSATVGDLTDMVAERVGRAVDAVADCGVDYVKVGFFPGQGCAGCLRALSGHASRGIHLVAVLFGDLGHRGIPLSDFATAGFAGVMLDTAGKHAGSIRRQLSDAELAEFVAEARGHGLLTGLAGSLTQADIAPLLELRPDYLGFRGALCHAGVRTDRLDATAFARIRGTIGIGTV
jgi:uncharacterized protein (UPF0264 family)